MKAVKGLKTVNNNANPPLLPKDDAHWQRLIAKVQAMTLMDDIFFNCFMEDDTAAMQYVLNIIMERHDLKVISVKTQYAVPNIYGRGVRFDVLAIDQYGREYNFEVQNVSSGAAPKRARYNIDMLDLRHLKAGDDFDDLPETYVIFITAKDVLGYGLPIYHIDRHINELGIKFDDMAHIIYVNGENKSDTPLGRLMQDFQNADPAKMHSRLLADKMKHLKSLDEEVCKMCNIVEEYVAERMAEAKAELAKSEAARAESEAARVKAEEKAATSKLDSIKNLMKNTHWSAEKAMEAIGIPKSDYTQYLALL